MGEPQTKTPSVQELVASLPARIFKRDALLVVVTLVGGAGAAVWAQVQVNERLRASVDGGLAPIRIELENHIKASNNIHATEHAAILDLQRDVAELRRQAASAEERAARRFDVLYSAILERRPQPEAAELGARDGGR